MTRRVLVLTVVLAVGGALAPSAWSEPDGVRRLPRIGVASLNGVNVRGVHATLDIKVDVAEFREGGTPGVRLIVGVKHYALALHTGRPIAQLDAELPVAAPGTRFTVLLEDGRQFVRCVLAGLTTEHAERVYVYALQCEDVTVPGE